jgi:hypothetical protein
MFRHSCGVCHFTNLHRPSDITLADFWGWENNVPDMNGDDKGISLVLLNTELGKRIFENACHELDYKKVCIENSLQPNLCHPSEIHPQRKKFEEDYKKRGFEYVLRHYDDNSWKKKCKRYLSGTKKIIKTLFYGSNK